MTFAVNADEVVGDRPDLVSNSVKWQIIRTGEAIKLALLRPLAKDHID